MAMNVRRTQFVKIKNNRIYSIVMTVGLFQLKLEDWRDNPDKQLLDMGGVVTEHAER